MLAFLKIALVVWITQALVGYFYRRFYSKHWFVATTFLICFLTFFNLGHLQKPLPPFDDLLVVSGTIDKVYPGGRRSIGGIDLKTEDKVIHFKHDPPFELLDKIKLVMAEQKIVTVSYYKAGSWLEPRNLYVTISSDSFTYGTYERRVRGQKRGVIFSNTILIIIVLCGMFVFKQCRKIEAQRTKN